MTILLCGQESLYQKFGLSALEPPANSITVSVSTDGLPQEETVAYIESRITDCGGHPGMFTQRALKYIHQASVGVLRTVGTIATSSAPTFFYPLQQFGHRKKTTRNRETVTSLRERWVSRKQGMGDRIGGNTRGAQADSGAFWVVFFVVV